MCGIAGIIHANRDTSLSAVQRMIDAITHRGPDDQGVHAMTSPGHTIAFGHRRLSIIDISPLGHQPMTHPETGSAIVFNGEIYNFQALRDELVAAGIEFRGASDTEVLLKGLVMHGPSYVERLEGMFAFAYFDATQNQAHLARDPMGIKPLLYAAAPGAFLFASELRGVVASGLVPKEMDATAIGAFLAHGAISEPRTLMRAVRMLEPGCVATLDLTQGDLSKVSTMRRYWRFPSPTMNRPPAELTQSIVSTIDHAVKGHMISDVPIGVFLSSGIDSTIVAWLASRHTSNLRTFTVGFSDQKEMSELDAARGTAELIGAKHTEIVLSADDALDAVMNWIAAMDQPSIDGLNTYLISRSVRREGVIVALSGLGGDELFCGYRTFADVPRGYQLNQRLKWIPSGARSALASTVTLGKSLRVRRKAADIAGCDGGLASHYLLRRRITSTPELRGLGVDVGAINDEQLAMCGLAMDGADLDATDPVSAISRYECGLYMRNTLLRDSDINGMAHSLEIRVPMLDHQVLALAHSIPGGERRPNGIANKALLRRSFPEALRSDLLHMPKRGFTLPIGVWMKGRLRDACESAIKTTSDSGLLDGGAVRNLWRDFLNSRESIRWSQAFSLCVLGWCLERAAKGN
ncbi:MAG TPA: asparagine synthase (glutamine-hydrolyzing) [Phycisphaerae bacterium]|nr:asparagine synthase (glutamine-hydrolyzing) [Phycisphaerae bacterium]HRW53230.1 asparagine synthase (glutamine-hydrolyzing) [Phycisphaerae bacterium]